MPDRIRISRIREPEEKIGVANLLYEGDGPFVPVTPLAILRDSTSFFKAQVGASTAIRAATSYDRWLSGRDAPETPGSTVDVFELASSIVRSPLGGFRDPSLQQVFAFVRLLDILYAYGGERTGEGVCVVAAIASGNSRSLAGMQDLGMSPIASLPR